LLNILKRRKSEELRKEVKVCKQKSEEKSRKKPENKC